MDLTRIDLDSASIPDNVIKLIPVDKALEFSVVPFGLKDIKGVKQLFVAMSDPTNLVAVDELKFVSGHQIRPAVASEDSIIRAIKRYYGIDVPGATTAPVKAVKSAQTGITPTAGGSTMSTEEKLKELIKILVEKKILDKNDLERFKG